MSIGPLAGKRSALALVWCLSVTGVVSASEPQESAPPEDAAAQAQLDEWDKLQRGLRVAVWASYSASAALGKDARGRTLAQDLDEWVMTDQVRDQMRAIRLAIERHIRAGEEKAALMQLKDASAATQEQWRLFLLINFYWQQKGAVDRQRDLWLPWLEQVPEAAAAESRTRIKELEATVVKEFSPTESLDTLSARFSELQRIYNAERIKLAGWVSHERGAAGQSFGSQLRTLPCPIPDERKPARGGVDRTVRRIDSPNSPDPAQFFPVDARRNGIAGTVSLRLSISASGCMERAEVVQSSGAQELDDAALDFSQYLSFEPAEQHGRAVASQPILPVNFKLQGEAAASISALPAPVRPKVGLERKSVATADDYVTYGNGMLGHGDYDLAIADFDQAIALDSRAAMAYADRGMAHFWKREAELARRDFDAAFSIDPNNPVVYRGRGMLALAAHQFAEAASAFTMSLDKEPHNEFALQRRASAYLSLGDLSKALTDTAEVIRLRPSNLSAYLLQALIYRMQGIPDLSMGVAGAVIAANPADLRAYVVAGSIYTASHNDSEALQTLDRALELMPSESAYLERATFRKGRDEPGRRADIEAALKLNPRSKGGLMMLAALQSDASAFAEAVATLNSAIESQGADMRLLALRGIAYARNQQMELAAKDFMAARASVTNGVDLNNLCWTLAIAGVALEEALSACDASLAYSTYEAPALDSRGFVLLRLARYDESIASYDAALLARPLTADSLYGRGLAKRGKGDRSGGEADIQLAMLADATVAKTFADYGLQP